MLGWSSRCSFGVLLFCRPRVSLSSSAVFVVAAGACLPFCIVSLLAPFLVRALVLLCPAAALPLPPSLPSYRPPLAPAVAVPPTPLCRARLRRLCPPSPSALPFWVVLGCVAAVPCCCSPSFASAAVVLSSSRACCRRPSHPSPPCPPPPPLSSLPFCPLLLGRAWPCCCCCCLLPLPPLSPVPIHSSALPLAPQIASPCRASLAAPPRSPPPRLSLPFCFPLWAEHA